MQESSCFPARFPVSPLNGNDPETVCVPQQAEKAICRVPDFSQKIGTQQNLLFWGFSAPMDFGEANGNLTVFPVHDFEVHFFLV